MQDSTSCWRRLHAKPLSSALDTEYQGRRRYTRRKQRLVLRSSREGTKTFIGLVTVSRKLQHQDCSAGYDKSRSVLSGRESAGQPRPMPCCRSEEHTSELQSRVDISYAVFC